MDYYSVLELKVSSEDEPPSLKMISRAYRKLALKYHPDKQKVKNEEALKKFEDIRVAYESLLDEKVRKEYQQKYFARLKRNERLDKQTREMTEELKKREEEFYQKKVQVKQRNVQVEHIRKLDMDFLKQYLKYLERRR